MERASIIENCKVLLKAYKKGQLGQTVMPEDYCPRFKKDETELCFSYFSLPMALNYQRNSYELWKSAFKTYQDKETRKVFNVQKSDKLSDNQLRSYLLKHKLALQPNKHVATWKKISGTISHNWGSFEGLLTDSDFDFLELKEIVQKENKKGFPYLSGPKIFNYWCFILNSYCKCNLKNSEFIDIAPDTHITKCSVLLGVITEKESQTFRKEKISARWREILAGSGINPIDMHPPFWFWSRNGFIFNLNQSQSDSGRNQDISVR